MMKGLVNSPALADPPITAILKPGFTALSNALIDSGLLAQLKPTEVNLFLVLARFSTGFLRLQAVIGEQKLLELTGASQSSLYEAKKGLVQRGLITISHTRTGRCLYQLGKLFQPLLTPGEQPEAVAKPVWSKPSGQLEANPSEQPESYKEFKEIQIQHHPVPAAPNPNDDDLLGSEVRGGVTGGSLVERLKQLGVNEFMAHRLIKSKPPEIIERALQRVRTLEVANPAGYLVSEILRGGYHDKPDVTKAQRDFHREVHEKRQAERLKLEQQHQQSQSQAEQLWQRFLSLPSGHQLELKQKIQSQAEREGFSRLRGWSEEHPTWRGLLLEEFQIWLTASAEKPASTSPEPCSVGVSPSSSPKIVAPIAGGSLEASSFRSPRPPGPPTPVSSGCSGASCSGGDLHPKGS